RALRLQPSAAQPGDRHLPPPQPPCPPHLSARGGRRGRRRGAPVTLRRLRRRPLVAHPTRRQDRPLRVRAADTLLAPRTVDPPAMRRAAPPHAELAAQRTAGGSGGVNDRGAPALRATPPSAGPARACSFGGTPQPTRRAWTEDRE